jgi:hypothetical protein
MLRTVEGTDIHDIGHSCEYLCPSLNPVDSLGCAARFSISLRLGNRRRRLRKGPVGTVGLAKPRPAHVTCYAAAFLIQAHAARPQSAQYVPKRHALEAPPSRSEPWVFERHARGVKQQQIRVRKRESEHLDVVGAHMDEIDAGPVASTILASDPSVLKAEVLHELQEPLTCAQLEETQ